MPRHRTTALCLALALLVTLGLVAGLGRKLSANTINPTAVLGANGHRITLTGPNRCTQTEWVALRVTVTQRTTGAMAEGYTVFMGSTVEQQWMIVARTVGGAAFEPGPATAVAVAVSSLHGEATDAHQWLVPVTIE